MSRYTGSIFKKSRALGISLLENNKEFSKGKKRRTAPGQHGNNERRKRRISAFSVQNREKRKVRLLYGLRDRQLLNIFIKEKKKKGDLATNILIVLESRVDNILFRAGLGTRRFIRQIVNHGHILVNGKKVDIPSYSLLPNDAVTFSRKFTSNEKLNNKLKDLIGKKTDADLPKYVSLDRNNFVVSYVRYPSFEEASNKSINFQSILEWYNRRT